MSQMGGFRGVDPALLEQDTEMTELMQLHRDAWADGGEGCALPPTPDTTLGETRGNPNAVRHACVQQLEVMSQSTTRLLLLVALCTTVIVPIINSHWDSFTLKGSPLRMRYVDLPVSGSAPNATPAATVPCLVYTEWFSHDRIPLSSFGLLAPFEVSGGFKEGNAFPGAGDFKFDLQVMTRVTVVRTLACEERGDGSAGGAPNATEEWSSGGEGVWEDEFNVVAILAPPPKLATVSCDSHTGGSMFEASSVLPSFEFSNADAYGVPKGRASPTSTCTLDLCTMFFAMAGMTLQGNTAFGASPAPRALVDMHPLPKVVWHPAQGGCPQGGQGEVPTFRVDTFLYPTQNATADDLRHFQQMVANLSSGFEVDVLLANQSSIYIHSFIRGVAVFSLVMGAIFYRRVLKESADPLRPEHSLGMVGYWAVIFLANPFFILGAIPAEALVGYRVLRFVAEVLLLKPPVLFTAFSDAAGYCVIVVASASSLPAAAERRRIQAYFLGIFLTEVALEIALCISVGRVDAISEVNGTNMVAHAIAVLRSLMWMLISVRLVLAVFGCFGSCCGTVREHLQSLPYYASRDRQLSVRLIQLATGFIVLQLGLSMIMDMTTMRMDMNMMTIMAITVHLHVLTYCTMPVFLESSRGLPPSPCTTRWKVTRWKDEWFEWVRTTRGALTLYQFLSVEEEERFWAINRPVSSGQGNTQYSLLGDSVQPVLGMALDLGDAPVHFMNYEKGLWAVHLSAEAYKLDCFGAQVSAVAAALCVAACARDLEVGRVRGDSTDSQLLACFTRKAMEQVPLTMEAESRDFTLLRVLQKNGLQVTFGLALSGKYLTVAFRGSSNIENWKADFNVSRVPYREMTEVERASACCERSVPCVHRGFAQLWEGIAADVSETLADLAKRVAQGGGAGQHLTVMVTGHSLGAALATLCGYTLRREGWDVEVWAFGCPMLGNKAFQVEYDAAVRKCFRIVNENDVFTQAAFTAQNRHVGKKVLVSARNGMLSVDPPWFEAFSSPRQYLWGRATSHAVVHYKRALASAYLSHGAAVQAENGAPLWNPHN